PGPREDWTPPGGHLELAIVASTSATKLSGNHLNQPRGFPEVTRVPTAKPQRRSRSKPLIRSRGIISLLEPKATTTEIRGPCVPTRPSSPSGCRRLRRNSVRIAAAFFSITGL